MAKTAEEELIEEVGACYADVPRFLKMAWQWEEATGPLARYGGPEKWVLDVADDISEQIANNKFDGYTPVPVIYVGIGSGNGCAKSAFLAMMNAFIQSTRPMSRATVTANTGAQLRTKTWPEFTKWMNTCITKHWFDVQAESIRHVEHGAEWATNMMTWSLNNPSAFAGQHSRDGSSTYFFDECARIPEAIFGEADGGLTDGEPFWFLTGNPTNRAGRLFRAVFGDLKKFYISRSIDSRTCQYTNKEQIKKWEIERGADSDWFRSHVKGLPPNAGDLQFIDNQRVQDARNREVMPESDDEPLIMGIDFARGGSNANKITWRRGRDARSIKGRKIPGEKTRDTTLMIAICAEEIIEKQPDAVCGDAGGLGGPIMDQLRKRFPRIPVIDVMFGGKSPDDKCGNMRSYMWKECKDWLPGGCIEDSEDLEIDLTGPEFYENDASKLMLESKEDMEVRGLESPDDGDSLALTFAAKVQKRRAASKAPPPRQRSANRVGGKEWMKR